MTDRVVSALEKKKKKKKDCTFYYIVCDSEEDFHSWTTWKGLEFFFANLSTRKMGGNWKENIDRFKMIGFYHVMSELML